MRATTPPLPDLAPSEPDTEVDLSDSLADPGDTIAPVPGNRPASEIRFASGSTILPPPEGALRAPRTERIRVSVRTSVRDPTLLIVRRLPPGEALPAGTREALLVMTNVRDTLSDAEPVESDFGATPGGVAP